MTPHEAHHHSHAAHISEQRQPPTLSKSITKESIVKAGKAICYAGEDAHYHIVILDGIAKMLAPNSHDLDVAIDILGPGDAVAASKPKHLNTIKALVDTRVAFINKKHTLDHETSNTIINGEQQRSARLINQLVNLGEATMARTANILIDLGERFGALRNDGSYELTLPAKQDTIGQVAHISRPTFNRAIAQLLREGAIERVPGNTRQYIIHPAELYAITSENLGQTQGGD